MLTYLVTSKFICYHGKMHLDDVLNWLLRKQEHENELNWIHEETVNEKGNKIKIIALNNHKKKLEGWGTIKVNALLDNIKSYFWTFSAANRFLCHCYKLKQSSAVHKP